MRRFGILALMAMSLLVSARRADAQVWKKVKEQAKEKLDKRVEKSEGKIVERTGKVVDSTVEKVGRGVDTTVAKAGTVVDTVLNKTEHATYSAAGAVANSLKGSDEEASKLAQDLADGRAVVADIRFQGGSDQLETSSAAAIKRLAKVLSALDGTYLIEAHANPSADPSRDLDLTNKRAAVVKARLVAEGVPVSRLFSMGFGATRPTAAASARGGGGGGGTTPNGERIEVSKPQ